MSLRRDVKRGENLRLEAETRMLRPTP